MESIAVICTVGTSARKARYWFLKKVVQSIIVILFREIAMMTGSARASLSAAKITA